MYKDIRELVPCRVKPGFFKVPGKPASVNKEGDLFHYGTERIYSSSMYPTLISLNKTYIRVNDLAIHICIAETFLSIPPGKCRKNVIVNHKDGIKTNNRLENLEWVDYSGNIKHAYEIGLRTDNVRLKAMNIETGEVLEFLSIGECARYFKVNNNRVFGYINRKIRETAFLDKYLLCRDVEILPDIREAKSWRVSDNRIAVIAFNKNTHNGVIYQTIAHAAKAIGIKQQTLSKRMRRAAQLNTYEVDANTHVIIPIIHGQEYLQYVTEDTRSHKWERNFRPPVRTKPRVKVTNLKTEEIKEFDNIYEMARFFGLRHETVMKKQKANNGIFKGHRIELNRPLA